MYLTAIVRTRWVDYKDKEFDPYVALDVKTWSKADAVTVLRSNPDGTLRHQTPRNIALGRTHI